MSILNTIQLLQNLHGGIQDVVTAKGARVVTWEAETFYVTGRTVRPTAPTGFFYEAQGEGTSGATEPTWPTVLNDTIVDGEITWKAISDEDPLGLPSVKIIKDNFPLTMVHEGEAAWTKEGGNTQQQREFEVSIFLDEFNQKRHAEAQGLASVLLQRFGEAYTNPVNRNLSNDIWIVTHLDKGIRDQGFGMMPYLSDEFYGVLFTVTVASIVVRS